MSFGQSFQITPVIMLRAAAAIVNGGKLVTPHFAVKAAGADGETVQEFLSLIHISEPTRR